MYSIKLAILSQVTRQPPTKLTTFKMDGTANSSVLNLSKPYSTITGFESARLGWDQEWGGATQFVDYLFTPSLQCTLCRL